MKRGDSWLRNHKICCWDLAVPYQFRSRQRVEFADTDLAGIAHFSNFFRYMERAEHEFLRSLGLSVHTVDGDDVVSWPRVHADCKYYAPLKFEDELDVDLLVRRKRANRSPTSSVFASMATATWRPSVRLPWSASRSTGPPGG